MEPLAAPAPSYLSSDPPAPSILATEGGHDIVDELLEMDLDDCRSGDSSRALAIPLIPNLPVNPLTFDASASTLVDEGEGKWSINFFDSCSQHSSSSSLSSSHTSSSYASSTGKTKGRRKYGHRPSESSSSIYKMSTVRMDLLAKYGVSPTPDSYLPRQGDDGRGEKYSSNERNLQSEAMQRQQRQAAKLRNQRKKEKLKKN